VQSFDERILRRMGRAHDARQAESTVKLFHSYPLRSFNVDLITGFPGQTEETVMASADKALELKIPHITLYMFREFAEDLVSVDQLKRGHREQTDRAMRARTYDRVKEAFAAAGYTEYITGYFAKDALHLFDSEDYYFSLRGDHIGFGAGASSILGGCFLK